MPLLRNHRESGSAWLTAAWVAGGAALLAMAVVLSVQSGFLWTWAWSSKPATYSFVALSVLAGILYLLVIARMRHAAIGRWGLLWILLAGLLMRAVLLPSMPVLETDSFRYMWDGALTSHRINPYSHTPEEGKRSLTRASADPELRSIAQAAGPWLNHINHPDVKSIYPPVAQAAFVVAHWIEPWSGAAWRAVLLLFDLATLVILICLLKRLRLPVAWVAFYWWNPLAIREFYCCGHMDVIALPLVMGSILLTLDKRTLWAMICLAGAVATKLWPVILLPLLLRPVLRRPRRLIPALATFSVMTGLLLLPMLLAGSSGIAGTQRYARTWEGNDGLFRLNLLFWENVLSISPPADQLAARWTAAILLMLWIAWLVRKTLDQPRALADACLFATAGLFLLSPTQFPWYYTWMLPLLALRPRWSLLLYTALLPLYYLYNFQPGWVWVEHVPVWALLLSEWWWDVPRFDKSRQPTEQQELAINAPCA